MGKTETMSCTNVLSSKLFTRTLTNADSPVVIIQKQGITKFSLEVTTGTCEILGTLKLGSLESNAVELTEGQVVTDTSQGGGCEITITIPKGSVVKMIASQS